MPAHRYPLPSTARFGSWTLRRVCAHAVSLSCAASFARAAIFGCAAIFGLAATAALDAGPAPAQRITWADAAPLHGPLEAQGVTGPSFDTFVATTHADSVRRVREGDWDHLVFYALQSTRFTRLPPIEPALSAKALVESLGAPAREAFLEGRSGVEPAIPPAVQARVTALLTAVDAPGGDSRLTYFRSLVRTASADRRTRAAAVLREYLRAMRFIYQKEFVAQRAGADAVAGLYRTRGLSTDTAVEAGYVVYTGLGIVRALDPAARIRRVLIVGPGMDLAPRTGLLEDGPPESYQPWAVIDALLALGLSRSGDLDVVGADINPRVVDHLSRSQTAPPVLTLVSGIREGGAVTLSPDYRDYFAQLGGAIGTNAPAPGGRPASAAGRTPSGHLRKIIRVGPQAASALTAASLDVVTERLAAPRFDLIIATNILPYFDDVQLMLALTNISGMLAPGGVFLHNEARPMLEPASAALGLAFEQSRQVVIANVRGAAPLSDSIWIHRKRR